MSSPIKIKNLSFIYFICNVKNVFKFDVTSNLNKNETDEYTYMLVLSYWASSMESMVFGADDWP